MAKNCQCRSRVENGGGGFLGKPTSQTPVVKNDVEFILMQRKSGGYRTPSPAVRILSVFQLTHTGIGFQTSLDGVAWRLQKEHPAPYPLELAERPHSYVSFVGDTFLIRSWYWNYRLGSFQVCKEQRELRD